MSMAAMSSIANNLKQTNSKITAATLRRPENLQYVHPRLVAVSKTKSIDMIIEAYDAGQRNFGENYVVELVEKANDIELLDRCEDIKWHFIGHLQRNKVSKVLGIPNLNVVETIDSERLAKSVNDAWKRLEKNDCLQIMVQVNTSGEEKKNGVALGETVKLVEYIKENCPLLKLMGLMTIGAYDYNPSAGLNPDFMALVKEREEVCKALDYDLKEMELSMGMSSDFEQAVELGSTNVRVGSTIFGGRAKPASHHSSTHTPSSTNTEKNEPSANVNISDTDLATMRLEQIAFN